MEWLYHIGVPEDQIEDLAVQQRQHRTRDDALYRCVLHAPSLRRPAQRGARTAA